MSNETAKPAAADDKRRMLAELLKRKAAAPRTFPVSFAQQRVWFLAQLDPEGAAYNVDMTLRLKGPLDEAVLRRALDEVVRRHEGLRTHLATRDGEPVQVVEPTIKWEIERIDVSHLDKTGAETIVRDHVRTSLSTPFALDAAPLFRVALLRTQEREHFLSLVFHHAVVDGWSQQVISGEMMTLYRAFAAGLPSPLPPVALQYADFAVWQREQLQGEALEAQLAFWREALEGAPPTIELPTDRPRPDVAGHAGDTLIFHAGSREDHDGINALLVEEGTTPFVGFLAMYAILLSRWSGQDRVVVGTPVLGRPRQELEGVVGYFANTLALHVDLTGAPTFRQLLRRLRGAMLHAFEHADLPFEKLVEELRVERSLRHNPLYQVMFSFGGIKVATDESPKDADGKALPASEIDELLFLPATVQGSVAQVEVSMTVTANEGRYYSTIEYRTELFDADTIERLGDQVKAILASAVAQPDVPIARLNIHTDKQRDALAALAVAPLSLPRDVPVHRRFEARAGASPDAPAVVFAGETVTYGELDARATALAHRLRAAGIGPEVRVGVFLRHSVEAVVSLLAVLKAGGTYVPLDPAVPADRTAYVVDDAGIRAVLTTHALSAALPATEAVVLRVDGEEDASADVSPDALPEVDPDSAAYVIYTSGSTGRPKGVVVSHGAFAGSVLAMAAATEMAAEDRYLLFASLSFDASLEQVSMPLVTGASLAIRGAELWLPEAVPAHLEALGVTCCEIPPAYLRQVLEDPARVRRMRRRLRFLMVSGEAVAPAVARAWLADAPDARMFNAYGPTETAITATLADLRGPADPAPHGSVPIGPQTGERTAYVLDAGGLPAPLGVPGELCVGGPLLARGYHGRPALTAAAFVPDPFSAEPGARMYRTGDRVRRLPDGSLEFFGRFDEQVKVRGFRIELGEVEAALRAHPGVADAVAAVRGEGGDARLVGYVVPAPGHNVDAGAVRDAMVERLPEYLAPSTVMLIGAVPMTPTGKVDRRALPEPHASAREDAYVAPRTETERVLAEIWGDVLGVSQVGARDHFFELGGHSLLATRVVSRVREALGVELPLRVLFEEPTVALLAAWLGDGAPAADEAAAAPIPRLGAVRAPASFAQERLWFIDRLTPGGTAYNMQSVVPVRGVEADVLRRVLAELARRHESLRTIFEGVGGGAVQVIHPSVDVPLTLADVSHLPPAQAAEEAQRVLAAESGRPYDLERGPLFRAALVTAGEAQWVVLGMHHIVGDGWSLDVLEREMAAIYPAFAAGEPSPLAEPALQYADYAAWQRERLTGDLVEAQLAYWRGALAGAPALLELPTDRPRPAVQTFPGAASTVVVPRRVGEAVGALAREESATPFMVLLAAFSLLLSRYAGQDDVVVGSPVAGRTRAEAESMVGLFLNTLALRTDLSGDPTFRQLLARVREATLGAYAHQELPFERLVEDVVRERSLAHAPLFQVMFVLQNTAAAGEADVDALENAADAGVTPAAKFDLTLSLAESGGGFAGALEYNTDLFDGATARRMCRHVAALVEAAVSTPDAPLSRLAFLGDDERETVLSAWNETARPFPADATLHGLFADVVAETPDAVAVAWGAGEMTYGELDARANHLAHRLVSLGVGPDVPVAISVERSPEMVIAVMAALKAGGAYVPVDPAYPRDRREYMLRDCGAPVVLTRPHLAGDLPETQARVVLLDDASLAPSRDVRAPAVPVSPENLAYVIYTSGSTGKPKGVMVPHRGVVNLARVQQETFGIGRESRVLMFASFSFDAAAMDLFNAMTSGAALHVAPQDALMPGAPLAATLRERAITTALIPPSALAAMDADGFPALRVLGAAGEACPPDVARRWSEGRLFINAYGPTEITVCATMAPGEDGSRRPSIGRAIPNARLYVLDGAMNPVPVGVPGELFVGGVGVTRGYLRRPDLTSERYLPDPFSGDAGGRLYRTGDRVRWLETGELDFLGRVDEQVKVRGFRIELGEIEAVLGAHPSVSACVVVARPAAAGDLRLAAYVVPAAGETADGETLRAHVRASLPDYMVPAAVVVLDALPVTPNGKVDRKALPEPEMASGTPYVAPRTETERALAAIWAEVLGVEQVGAEDDFFARGGHSLLAMRVVSRILDVLGADVPLRTLFQASTLSALAAEVDAAARAEAGPPVVAVPRDGPVPASFAQRRLWFVERLVPGTSVYNTPLVLPLTEAEPATLERALAELVRRHESLRTTFAEGDGEPVQVIAPAGGFRLAVEDLSHLPSPERDAALVRRVEALGDLPFDLEAGPLFRATLLTGAASPVLVLAMHHAVSDGWSMDVLRRELEALYRAFSAGEPSPLTEPALQYADYAAWQRDHLSGPRLDAQLAFWRGALAGAPALLELPTDRPRPPVQTYPGAAAGVVVRRAAGEALSALARREGATPFMVLLAAFSAVLSRYAGQDDVVVGSPVAGRTRPEVEGMIGLFVNTLALRTDLSGDPTFRDLVGRVRETTLGAFAHQELPFEKLVEEIDGARSLAHPPLFQVMFVLQNTSAAGDLDVDAFEVGGDVGGTSAAKFDLTLTLSESGGGFAGALEYNTDLFDAATARRLCRHVAAMVEAAVAQPDVPLSRLSLSDETERAHVLAAGTGPVLPPLAETIHGLFEAAVRHSPDATALVHGGRRVTYAALNARANRIAHRLRALGVGPETRVGVCMARTPDLIAALLGVLKAGGAYVPLDPAHPADRIAVMVGDAGTPVVLTQSHLTSALPKTAATVVAVDTDAEIAAAPEHDPSPLASPDCAAYVIFTSGSTGRPKGVEIEHRNAVDFLRWFRGEMSDDELRGMLGATSVSFDVSVAEIFGTLCWGGRLILVENALSLPEVAGEDVRVATMVPGAAAELLRMGAVPPSVAAFNLAGEALPLSVARDLNALQTVERVRNLYGPTEDTTYATFGVVAPDADRVGIGRPLANRRAYVLDAALAPAPVGVPGELWLAGSGVARGYVGRPGMTAERFLPDPFGPAGARMYRTGDRARWLEGGALEYLGRIDQQVKVRGFRIEPGEIESVLAAHPSVSAAAVVARQATAGDLRLVAYVVPAAGASVDGDEMKAHVRASLPDYMVPSAVVSLDAFPVTPNGKLDRRALPAPELASAVHVPPRTETERALAAIWAEVLGVEKVGVDDDFFALGGHSLLATRVVSRVRDALGADVALRTMFEAPTLAALAARVEAAAPADAAPPLVAVSRSEPLPLSFAQRRLWFFERLVPGTAVYNVPDVLPLAGVDADVLERALAELVRRHESLRTSFAEVDEEPVQVIAPAGDFHLSRISLTHLPVEQRDAEMRRVVDEESARPFDMAGGPLFRAVHVDGGDAQALVMAMHHAVSDGWSIDVLRRELEALYRAFAAGEPSPLPEPALQYADYAAWQRKHLAGPRLDAQVAWWRDALAGAPPLLELPTDRPRPAVQTFPGGTRTVVLRRAAGEALSALARDEGATPFMALLAAFSVLLSRYAGQDDVVVGSPVAGRTRPEVEGMVGFFVNTLALRTDVSGDPTFRQLLARVRETTLGAFAHQDVPFEKLVEEVETERSLAHSPLFQVMFALQNTAAAGDADVDALEPGADAGGVATSKFDLTLSLAESGGGFAGTLEYNTDLFDAGTVVRMARHLAALVDAAVARPDVPLSRLSMLAGDERETVLSAWNDTARPFRSDATLHGLFAEVAARTPDAVAVAWGEGEMTYGTLDARANHLAHRLVSLGVGPDVPVAISVDRSPEMVVALLAALKAGGAYVPVDPAYPADRREFMLRDCGAPVVLTRAHLAGDLPGTDATVLVLDDGTAGEMRDAPAAPVSPDHLAYVIYTSGSTGRPKGVMVPHRGVVNLIAAQSAAFGVTPESRVLQFASFSFDAAVMDVFNALLSGAALHVAPADALMPGAPLAETVRARGITTALIPPSALAALGDEALPSLRTLISGGEACPPEVARRWSAGRTFVNAYGPTEITVSAAMSLGEDGARRPSIGRALPNTRLYVLDGAMNPVPVGVPGELYVGGVGVTRGYLRRPDLTAERYLPDPFSGDAGGRLYRTGDRVRWLESGELDFLGRVDEQVKVRGFRIELGEIEVVVAAAPGVAEAVAVVRGDGGDRRIVAYAVPAAGASLDGAELKRAAAGRLPDYMVPSAVVVLDALPLTPNGKVDRRALPAPDLSLAAADYVAPRTPEEEAVARIFAELLGADRVGARDDFFLLGGHSLSATQLVTRIRGVLGADLPLRAVFEGPTVEALAARAAAARAAPPAAEGPRLVARSREGHRRTRPT